MAGHSGRNRLHNAQPTSSGIIQEPAAVIDDRVRRIRLAGEQAVRALVKERKAVVVKEEPGRESQARRPKNAACLFQVVFRLPFEQMSENRVGDDEGKAPILGRKRFGQAHAIARCRRWRVHVVVEELEICIERG